MPSEKIFKKVLGKAIRLQGKKVPPTDYLLFFSEHISRRASLTQASVITL